ncbi:MAG: FAD-dependent oxidoreductase [Acidobacteriota bacterium]
MSANSDAKYLVAVVGAGPAGLYASRELVGAGCRVALFNRDVKPGGLAEYGIFHNKIKMKTGLRKQFAMILADPNVEYYGNVVVGEDGDLTLKDLEDLGFQAILVTVGAQGTKWLGLPGEELEGVYHAKDVVYHYNHLPPFSQEEMKTGDKLLIIGLGNVMCDIAHWAVRDLKLKEVGAIVRRGPGQAKFTPKEWQVFARNLDLDDFEEEWARCVPKMEAVGEDIDEAKAVFLDGVEKGKDPISDTRFFFRFFHSPKGMVGENGKCTGLEVEETYLEDRDGYLKAIGTGNTQVIPCDSVVFCIGDKVDDNFGLPIEWNEFVKNPEPRYPVEETSYEAFDPSGERDLSNIFVAGWSRKASDGLVGVARKDGTNGAHAVLQYLEDQGEASSTDTQALKNKLAGIDKVVVHNDDVPKLFEAEAKVAEAKGVEEFKYDTNEEMLAAIAG